MASDNDTSCKPPYTKENPYCCTTEDYLQCDGECFGTTFQGDLDWYHFLLSSIGTWLAAALIVLIPRLIYAPLKVNRKNCIIILSYSLKSSIHSIKICLSYFYC